MATFDILSQADEDDLHAKRLLNIEEKPFKRVQKRLLAPTNPIQQYLRRSATSSSNEDATSDADIEIESPNNGDASNGKHTTNGTPKSKEEIDQYLASLTTFTHQTLHDFSALNTSLARLQFLLTANQSERARYTSQTTTITTQHEQITSETSTLRSRLDEARSRLEQRKLYDELAKKVLYVNGKDNSAGRSKTRDELGRESERLRSEIEELEREGEELKVAWRERRDGLARVAEESTRLRRIVRGEPEHEAIDAEHQLGQAADDTRSDDGEETGEKRREEDESHQHHQKDDDDDHHSHNDDDLLGAGGNRDREGGGMMGSNVGTPRPLEDAPTPTPFPAPMIGEPGSLTPLPTTLGDSGNDGDGGMTPLSMADHDEGMSGAEGGGTPRIHVSESTGGGIGAGSSLKQEMRFESGPGTSAGGSVIGSEGGEDTVMAEDQGQQPQHHIHDDDEEEGGEADDSGDEDVGSSVQGPDVDVDDVDEDEKAETEGMDVN